MQAERKIEIQQLTPRMRFIGEGSKLFLNLPLCVEMIILRFLIVIDSRDVAAAQPRRPRVPAFALTIGDGAKSGIVAGLFILANEFAKSVGLLLFSEPLENSSFACHHCVVVDQLCF